MLLFLALGFNASVTRVELAYAMWMFCLALWGVTIISG